MYIYNGHWTGSQLWRLGCEEIVKLSVKIKYDLPCATQRYLIEPLTGLPHVRKILVKRFLSLINMIRMSSTYALVQLLETILRDVRCTTGSNLRTIMLMVGKTG